MKPAFNALAFVMAVWRLSSLLVNETGPWSALETLRFKLGAGEGACEEQITNGIITHPLCCLWCASVWCSLALLPLLIHRWSRVLIYWLAGSAGAILIQEQIND